MRQWMGGVVVSTRGKKEDFWGTGRSRSGSWLHGYGLFMKFIQLFT